MNGCCSNHLGVSKVNLVNVICKDDFISSCKNNEFISFLTIFLIFMAISSFFLSKYLKNKRIKKEKAAKYQQLNAKKIDLRKQGLTGDEIARKLKYSRSNVYKILKKGSGK